MFDAESCLEVLSALLRNFEAAPTNPQGLCALVSTQVHRRRRVIHDGVLSQAPSIRVLGSV